MYGQYNRNIDEKNRIAVPAKLRDDLGSKFYLTIGLEGVVEIRSEKEFNNFISFLTAQSQYDTNARMVRRFWLSNSQEVELDSQGRFVVPKQFLTAAAIQKEALFIGVGNLVELWGIQKYENYNKDIDLETVTKAAQELAHKDNK